MDIATRFYGHEQELQAGQWINDRPLFYRSVAAFLGIGELAKYLSPKLGRKSNQLRNSGCGDHCQNGLPFEAWLETSTLSCSSHEGGQWRCTSGLDERNY